MKIFKTPVRIESKYISDDKGLNEFIWLIRNERFLKSYEPREVNSIYYDDQVFTSISDNLSGSTPRTKFRLRWYKDINGNLSNFQFEKKIKNGITGHKEQVFFDQKYNPLEGKLSMKNLQKITGLFNDKLFPTHYTPKLLCNYYREYYEREDGSRFTIDKNIRFKQIYGNSLVNNKFNFLSTNQIIMELKFSPENIKKIATITRKLPIPSTRCSKYLLGHSKLNGVSYI